MKSPRAVLATVICSPDSRLTEEEMTALWRYIIPKVKKIRTTDGQVLRLHDSGRVNRFSGPDLKDVVVEINGRRRRGDLEIHRQAADWYRHGHHNDPEFNRVIIHLCFRASPDCPTRRQDGQFVPVVELAEYLPRLQYLLDRLLGSDFKSRLRAVKHPCYRGRGGSIPEDTLQKVALCWFWKRVSELKRIPARRRLFQPLVEALGYTANHRQFRRLARRIEVSEYYRLLFSNRSRSHREAWLLGIGGWLSGRTPVNANSTFYRYRRIWEDFWQQSPRVKKSGWVKRGVRPHSYPHRRWLIFARATAKLNSSWSLWLFKNRDLLFSGNFRTEIVTRLDDIFSFYPGSYWNHHYGFAGERRDSLARPVGRSWIERVLINVILPWYYLCGLRAGDRKLLERVEELFLSWPCLLKNRRTQILKKQLGISKQKFSGAASQQAAVYLYKNFCRAGLCSDCPLSNWQPDLFEQAV
ncbi:MAG: DUF2851 family protein [bacterium]